MSQVEMFDNLLSVLNFVKIFCQIFQFRFWVTNNLNVTIKIIQICLENGVYRLRIGKIVRLNHKDKKMNGRSPAYRRAQHRIQCHAISTEHTLKAIFTAFLQVIEYNNETIGLVQKSPRRNADFFCISIRNGFAAANHFDFLFWGTDRRSLIDFPNYCERAISGVHQTAKNLWRKFSFALPSY